jgi:DNA-binding response OmpR family regulator
MMITLVFTNSISLPALLSENPPLIFTDDPEPRSKFEKLTGKSKRILVIDDETSIADSLTEILSGYGYDAVACYEGQAAIDAARSRCPDAVIADVIMPGLNGVETVLAIRELCPTTRILLFSGQAATMELLSQARNRGHEFEILPKPVHPNELLKKLAV